jgi:hypothetical protein
LIIDKMCKFVGQVASYNTENLMAEVSIEEEVKVGDNLIVDGHYTSIIQSNKLMEFEGVSVKECSTGRIHIKVSKPVRRGDKIYRIQKPYEITT